MCVERRRRWVGVTRAFWRSKNRRCASWNTSQVRSKEEEEEEEGIYNVDAHMCRKTTERLDVV